MFTLKHFINIASSSLIGLISLIFVYKYSLIYFNHPLLFAFGYALLFLFVIFSFDKIKTIPKRKDYNKYFLEAIILFILLILYYVFFTKKASSSFELLAIKNWLDNFYSLTFPYQLKNTFTAFPFLYFLASPFYWIGNIALLEILAWGTLSFLLIFNSISIREKVIKLFFLLVSPLTFYGLFESPVYFLLSIILIVLIYFSNKYINPSKVDKYFIWFAVIFGLFFAVRIEVIVVLIIYFLYLFRNNLKEGFLFCEILLAVFIVTIVPFILWNPKMYFFNGPFNSFFIIGIPWLEIIFYLLVAIYIGWIISDLQEIFFVIGILSIIPEIISFIFTSNTSISNFIFCIPFLILSIKDYRVEKFKGKILESF